MMCKICRLLQCLLIAIICNYLQFPVSMSVIEELIKFCFYFSIISSLALSQKWACSVVFRRMAIIEKSILVNDVQCWDTRGVCLLKIM